MRMRPYEGVDSRLLIVEATEKDINHLGYPISDGKLAETIERIKQHQPSIISEQKYQELILKNLRQKAQALGLELIPISHSTKCVS